MSVSLFSISVFCKVQKQNFGPRDVRFFLLYPAFAKCSRRLFPHWDASFLLKYWSFANAAVNIPYTRMPVSQLLFPSLQTFLTPGAVFSAICPSIAKCRNNEHYWHRVASFLLHYLSFPKNSANSAEIAFFLQHRDAISTPLFPPLQNGAANLLALGCQFVSTLPLFCKVQHLTFMARGCQGSFD